MYRKILKKHSEEHLPTKMTYSQKNSQLGKWYYKTRIRIAINCDSDSYNIAQDKKHR